MLKFLILFLFCGLITCNISYFEDRSGVALYYPQNFQDDSFLFVLEKFTGSKEETIVETSVADLVTHFIGLPILNAQTNRENFPKGNIFEKDRANLLLILNSVNADLVSQFPLKVLKQSGQQYKLIKLFYPQDSLASITTLFTGHDPSIHGIVNSYWVTSRGKKISAYSNVDSCSQVANLADVVSNTFGGRSLIISGSSDIQSSSALGVNRFAGHSSPNTFGFYWNDKKESFENLYSSSSIIKLSDKKEVIASLAKRTIALRNKGDKINFSSDLNTISVEFNTENLHVTFNLNNYEEFLFFSELELIESLIDSLKTSELKSLVDDSIPDLFSFSFSSLEKLDSKKAAVALLILDSVLSQVISEYQNLYNGKAAVEIAFMGTSSYDSVRKSNLKSEFKTSVYDALKKNQLYEETFPVIYSKSNSDAVCKILESKKLSRSDDLELYCPKINSFDDSVKLQDDSADVATFQIVLWFSIILVFILAGAIYSLCFLDTGIQPPLLTVTSAKSK